MLDTSRALLPRARSEAQTQSSTELTAELVPDHPLPRPWAPGGWFPGQLSSFPELEQPFLNVALSNGQL